MTLLPEKIKDLIIVSLTVSEGNNTSVIDEMARTIESDSKTRLIEVAPNSRTNHTLYIFGGSKQKVLDAAFRISDIAFKRINLQNITSEQKCLGVVEHISFIPLHSKNMDTAVKLSTEFAPKFNRQFNVPIYLFGFATKNKQRRDIRNFHQFEFNDWPQIIKKAEWQPDYGEASLNEKRGISIIGARYYHINFATFFEGDDIELIEELTNVYKWVSTKRKVYEYLPTTSGEDTDYSEIAELLKKIYTFVDEINQNRIARLLCNVPNYRETPICTVFEIFKQEAANLGLDILGTQIYGFLPGEVLVRAGRYYLESGQAKDQVKAEDAEITYMQVAVERLQLGNYESFNLERQVLDFHFQ